MRNNDIRAWMRKNARRCVDECGEVDATALVQIWDIEEATGGATLDATHPAWEIAIEVASAHMPRRSQIPTCRAFPASPAYR